jgi:hypothetical protein
MKILKKLKREFILPPSILPSVMLRIRLPGDWMRHGVFTMSSFLFDINSLFQALRQCGTDFSLMQAFFPRRTRKQLKNKFFREEGHHPELIKATLNSQLPLGESRSPPISLIFVDLAPFEVHLGTIQVEGANGEGEGQSQYQALSQVPPSSQLSLPGLDPTLFAVEFSQQEDVELVDV